MRIKAGPTEFVPSDCQQRLCRHRCICIFGVQLLGIRLYPMKGTSPWSEKAFACFYLRPPVVLCLHSTTQSGCTYSCTTYVYCRVTHLWRSALRRYTCGLFSGQAPRRARRCDAKQTDNEGTTRERRENRRRLQEQWKQKKVYRGHRGCAC